MPRPNFTAAQLAATACARIPSNQVVLGLAATQGNVKRTKVVKIVSLPPSTFNEAEGVATIVLPLPPKELHPNARCHWKAKLKPKQQARDEAMIITMAALKGCKPLWEAATVHLNVWLTTRAHADKDNCIAWVKNAVDGIVAAGIMANDSGIEWWPVIIEADRTCPHIELTFQKRKQRIC
jgi:hypothetical protein